MHCVALLHLPSDLLKQDVCPTSIDVQAVCIVCNRDVQQVVQRCHVHAVLFVFTCNGTYAIVTMLLVCRILYSARKATVCVWRV